MEFCSLVPRPTHSLEAAGYGGPLVPNKNRNKTMPNIEIIYLSKLCKIEIEIEVID